MKFFVSAGLFIFALSFCNLSERLSKLRSDGSSNQNSSANTSVNSSKTPAADETADKPELTGMQQDILNSGQAVKWAEQGITFTLPKNWKKMNVGKTSLNYSSPDLAFLIATVSPMPADFPADTSLKANYESALQQLQNGKYENVRYLEIDGIKGVEFAETMPENGGDPRRHQWIAFRTYLGQNQMLNIMTSTKGNNFDKHRDDFSAILYSMKIDK
jgi:hypothetical protein